MGTPERSASTVHKLSGTESNNHSSKRSEEDVQPLFITMKFITTVAASLLVLASLTIAADQERAVERHEAAHERAAMSMSNLRERVANLAKNYRAAERMFGQERINANLRERLANLAKAYQTGDGERIMQAAERMLGQERINAMNLRERIANLAKAYQAGHGERIMKALQAAER